MRRRPQHFAGIVLAAGASSRMGLPKPLLDAGRDRTFLASVARSLLAAGVTPVLVVVGSRAASVARHARRLGLRPVVNRRWRGGQLESARVGLRAALRGGATAALLCPVDLPRIRPATARAVAKASRRSPDAIVVPSCGRRTGHPIAVPAPVATAVGRDRRSRTLREALRRSGASIVRVAVRDAAIVEVLNTPEQYRRAFGRTPAVRQTPQRGVTRVVQLDATGRREPQSRLRAT